MEKETDSPELSETGHPWHCEEGHRTLCCTTSWVLRLCHGQRHLTKLSELQVSRSCIRAWHRTGHGNVPVGGPSLGDPESRTPNPTPWEMHSPVGGVLQV